jgi:hypothetical protein
MENYFRFPFLEKSLGMFMYMTSDYSIAVNDQLDCLWSELAVVLIKTLFPYFLHEMSKIV